LTYPLQIWYRDGRRTLLAYEPKSDPMWAWLGSRDPISKFWDPLITFERIELSASNLAQRWRTDPFCVGTIKRPLRGRGLGHVTQLRNFVTFDCIVTFERIELSARNLVH